METAIAKTDEFIEKELKRFETELEITKESLEELVSSVKGLTINGLEDRAGYKTVQDSRKKLKSRRVEIEKGASKLRESATRFSKAVIAREKEFVSILEPTEKELKKIEDEYELLVEADRKEKERKESERIQVMIDKLNAFDFGIDFHVLKEITDENFAVILKEAEETYNKKQEEIRAEKERQEQLKREEEQRQEQARKEEEQRQAEARKKEEERIEALRVEQEERERKFKEEQEAARLEQERIKKANEEAAAKLVEAQRKLDEERKAIEAAEEERKRLIKEEEDRKAAEEKARIEAEEKEKREAKEKEEREQKEAEEAAERLLQGSDKEKFEWISKGLNEHLIGDDILIWQNFKSKTGKEKSNEIRTLLKKALHIANENR